MEVARFLPTPCPICAEHGGFHDRGRHSTFTRPITVLDALAAEVGDGQELDDLLESLGQMARGEGRIVREGVNDVQDRR